MGDLLVIIILRTIIRVTGQYTRYYLYKLIGRKRTLKSLSNESKDDYKDMGKALNQDFFNAFIGTIILGFIIIITVSIVFG